MVGQSRAGRPARVICDDAKGPGGPNVYLLLDGDLEVTMRCAPNGKHLVRPEFDLVPAP